MKFNTQKEQLFTLIKSLTKAEKRNFKLYVNRFQSDSKFIQLFDVLDKLPEYDEGVVLKKLAGVKKRHLANLKRHLYKQLLVSLRLIYIQKNIDIEIREQLDFARILYGKGLYMQSLKLLERIKKIALDHHQDILLLEILEFQKFIEARHITRSRMVENKMEILVAESAHRSSITHTTSGLSNFNIQIQGYFIECGHARNEKEVIEAHSFFEKVRPKEVTDHDLTFFEKAHLFQARMWFYYILLDFPNCLNQARLLSNLFEVDAKMKEKDPGLYMRGLYYTLTFLFLEDETEEFEYYLARFEAFVHKFGEHLSANAQMVAYVYFNLSRLNRIFMTRRFEEGIPLMEEISKQMPHYEASMDYHRILLFHYKFAYLYFACGHYEEALELLNNLVHLKSAFLREDLFQNAHLLHLICHYELENFDVMEYLISSLHRAMTKSREIGQLQQETLDFLKVLHKLPALEKKKAFLGFQQKITSLESNSFEKKAIIYLNVPEWVESKLKNCLIKDLPKNVQDSSGSKKERSYSSITSG